MRAQSAPEAVFWPAFRGGGGTGVGEQTILALDQNRLDVAWVAEVPGLGHSSPVIQEDTVFLTTSYLNRGGEYLFHGGFWVAAISMVVLAWLAFTHGARRAVSGRGQFSMALHLWTLLLLSLLGYDLFACRNDVLRSGIFCVLVMAVALEAARALNWESRRAQAWVSLVGLVATAAGLFHFCSLPFLRQRWLVFSICLLPLCCTARCWGTLARRPRSPLLRKWFLPLMVLAVPLVLIGYVTLQARGNHWWRIQPTNTLRLSLAYYIGLAAVLVAACGLYGSPGAKPPRRRAGLALFGMACVLGLPVLAAPLVNSFEYTRYVLVRGTLESPIGWPGFGLATGGLMLAGMIAPYTSARLVGPPRPAGLVRRGRLILPLVAGACVCFSVFAGSSAGSVAALLAIDVKTGRTRWRAEGLRSTTKPTGSGFNSLATPTPVVAGPYVTAYFGERGAFATDRDTGALRWTCPDLPYLSHYGAASSLAGTATLVVIQAYSVEMPSYLVALSMANGRPAWKHPHGSVPSWRSPVIFRWQQRALVCAWAGESCDVLDLQSGELVCRLLGVEPEVRDPVSSPVVTETMVYFGGTARLVGVSLQRMFDLSSREVRLELGTDGLSGDDEGPPGLRPDLRIELESQGPTCSTPTLNNRWLFTISDEGVLLCLSRSLAKVVWKTEIGDTKSSPIIADQHLFAVNEKGRIWVFNLVGPEPVLTTTLDLGEPVMASPAAARGRLFVRTRSKLYCLRGAN